MPRVALPRPLPPLRAGLLKCVLCQGECDLLLGGSPSGIRPIWVQP